MKKKAVERKITIDGLLTATGVLLCIATLFSFLGKFSWVFDLFTHFRVQYFQLCLILIGVFIWRRRHKRMIAFLALALLNYAFVLPYYFGKPATPSGHEKPLRAMLMNINAGNTESEKVLAALKEYAPDFVLLQEVTPEWETKLKELDVTYPHRLAKPQPGCFGILFLSKYPFRVGSIVKMGPHSLPSTLAEIETPQGRITIFGTHPVPPISADYANSRNQQLAALPEIIQNQNSPVLLIGDLNTTQWSPHFKQLKQASGLKDSTQGFGFQPSWPAGNPFLKIPLDHMLHDPAIIIHQRFIGNEVGSDHLPVIVDFSLKR